MGVIDFTGVREIHLDGSDVKEVHWNMSRVWPSYDSTTHAVTPGDIYSAGNQAVTAYVGDTLRLDRPNQAGDYETWSIDGFVGLFTTHAAAAAAAHAKAGNYVAFQIPGNPGGWSSGAMNWDYNPAGSGSYRNGDLPLSLDTTGWPPGTYYVVGGNFMEFGPSGIAMTVTLLSKPKPPVPDDRVIQLPDNPFPPKTEDIDIYIGQTVILKYPKSPYPALVNGNLPANPGWRHLGFVAITGGVLTSVAMNTDKSFDWFETDMVWRYDGTVKVNGSMPGPCKCDNIGQFAEVKTDRYVHLTGRAPVGAVIYAIPYSGNYNTDEYNDDAGILYRFHVRDY